MELELKHLAPYLPYKLKILNGWSDIKTLNYTHLYDENNGFITMVKPILRPLSDLTKEIEVNGEKFVPAEILFSVEIDEIQNFKDFGEIPEYWKDAIAVKPRYYDYWQVEMLFEWHFDVFGLIEKGKAVDINTLNK